MGKRWGSGCRVEGASDGGGKQPWAAERYNGCLLEHDPEKWIPVFGSDHAQRKNPDLDPIQSNWIKVWSMIPKKPAPDLIRGGYRFSDQIMLKGKIQTLIRRIKIWTS